jgi:hypothetical protein
VTAPNPAGEFRAKLPRRFRDSLSNNQLIAAVIAAAIRDHGWTVDQLVAECTRDVADDVVNLGGLVTHRLRQAAQHPPVGSDHHATSRAKQPFCSPECRDNAGWLLDPQTQLPTGRCPCRTTTTERKTA